MDDRDLHEIRTRLAGSVRLLRMLDVLSTLHSSGAAPIADTDLTLPLTAAQKTAIKTRFTAILTRARAVADSLPVPTGLPGTVNAEQKALIEQAPTQINQLVTEWINVVGQPPEPTLQGDGTLRALVEPQAQQAIADGLATTRDCLKLVYTIIAARVP